MKLFRTSINLIYQLSICFLLTTSQVTEASDSRKVLSDAKKEIHRLPFFYTGSESGYSFGDSREDVKYIIKVLADPEEDIRIKKLAQIGLNSFQSKEAEKEMLKQAKNWENYNEFTIKAFHDMEAIPDSMWSDLIEKSDPLIAQLAVEYLTQPLLEKADIEKALTDAIEDKKTTYYLRLACIEKLQESPSLNFLKSLLKILKKDGAGELALNALIETTGEDYQYNIKQWNLWLKTNDASTLKKVVSVHKKKLIDLEHQPAEEGSKCSCGYGKHSARGISYRDIVVPTPSLHVKEKNKPTKSLYGVKVEGQNLLFFLDCSGSMSGQPFEILKDQMLYMAKTLGENYNIGVVFFPFKGNDSVLRYAKNTRAFQNRLKSFLSQKKVGGGTSIIGAMEYSYKNLISRYNPVDTIYVISDGAIGNPNERAMVYTLNARNRIRINTITVVRQTDFMSGVAMDNFGNSIVVQ